jgi:hypothetical protein
MRSLSRLERICVLALVLLAWAVRWAALVEVPAGWRDDDLIELYTFSGKVAEEGPELYFNGASGHEPLYHTLRAPLVALGGINQASARVMSAGAGTLAVLLTWAVGRRVLGRLPALLAGTMVALSFWGLMYSRFAVRHMGAVPWMLLAIYWGWRALRDPAPSRRALVGMATGIAIGTAGSLLTYYAGRVIPALLITLYPLAAPRRRRWQTYFAGVAIGLLVTVPMFWAATHIPGGDARVGEVALPLRALRDGDVKPLLQTAWTTLGMAHARGDPEWLYNTGERPVFGPLGAVFFYLTLAFNLLRWRRPEARVLLLWLAAGIGPALISLPPSSYGHTILALPAVYLLLASPVAGLLGRGGRVTGRRATAAAIALSVAITGILAVRDLPDYFVDWAEHSMVRFLYRADYRALAETMCSDAIVTDVAVGSMLFGPWDKVAVQTDCPRESLHIRWLNPSRALVFADGMTTALYLQDEGSRHPEIERLLADSLSIAAPQGMQGYSVEPVTPSAGSNDRDVDSVPTAAQPFGGALALVAVERLPPSDNAARTVRIATWWRVEADLPLPPEELLPFPSAPGVYNGPRLKVFAHLWDGESLVAIDDGLWVDPYSVEPGDIILQYHRFDLPDPEGNEELTLEMGLYDPKTEIRWTTPAGRDRLVLPLAP